MQSRITNEILKQVEPVANTLQHIIIIGEYGSGKSWMAKKIHATSNREEHPFVNVNCYTLDPDEAQKKIFGYLQFTDKGAKIKQGYLEKSNGGTLFLEGFDAFSESLQKKVLDSIESQKTYHVGSPTEIPIDVRIIISIDVKSYYNSQLKFNLLANSLNIEPYTISYPPLRQRREEIETMVQSFLKSNLARRYDFAASEISPQAMYLCIRYDWPGNVQQLKNAIEHAAIISAGNKIHSEHMPNTVKQDQPNPKDLEYLEHTYTYQIAEKQLIRKTLKLSDSPHDIIRMLGLSKKDFEEKLNRYQLEPELT